MKLGEHKIDLMKNVNMIRRVQAAADRKSLNWRLGNVANIGLPSECSSGCSFVGKFAPEEIPKQGPKTRKRSTCLATFRSASVPRWQRRFYTNSEVTALRANHRVTCKREYTRTHRRRELDLLGVVPVGRARPPTSSASEAKKGWRKTIASSGRGLGSVITSVTETFFLLSHAK